MPTLAEYANTYTKQGNKTFNIADLPKVSTKIEVKESMPKPAKDGTTFTYLFVEISGAEYRVPKTVLEQLQTILKFAPNLEFFKVTKTGTTKDDTKYKVEPVV